MVKNKRLMLRVMATTLLFCIVLLVLGFLIIRDRDAYILDNSEKSVTITKYKGYSDLLKLSEVKEFLPKDVGTLSLKGEEYISTDIFNAYSTFKFKEMEDGYYILKDYVASRHEALLSFLSYLTIGSFILLISVYFIYIFKY